MRAAERTRRLFAFVVVTVTVAAIREETDPEIDQRAKTDGRITVHWISLGELSRLIEIFHKEGVSKAEAEDIKKKITDAGGTAELK